MTPKEFIILVNACGLAGALWREHFIGSAAKVAKFKYRLIESVGSGCRLDRAFWYTWKKDLNHVIIQHQSYIYKVILINIK